jgi:CRP-like cAMP-binding protein
MTELTLFDEQTKHGDPLGRNFERSFERNQLLAHAGDPISSYRAGHRILMSGRLRGQMQMVLKAVQQNPGRTSAELAMILNMDRHQPARRLANLARRGLIRRGSLKMCKVCQTLCLSWYPAQHDYSYGAGA